MARGAVVIISKYDEDVWMYARYVSNVRTDAFLSPEPLSAYWVEVIRNAPEQLRDEEPEGRDIAEDEWPPEGGPQNAA